MTEISSQKKSLSAGTIKLIALIAMLIDHVAACVILNAINEGATWTLACRQQLAVAYYVMRYIGRISFPIYCFFIVEGFVKTRSRAKYAFRLAICALISEVPFDLAVFGEMVDFTRQNVFLTLVLGLLAIWVSDMIEKKLDGKPLIQMGLSLLCYISVPLLAHLLRTDYGLYGVVTIIAMYEVRTWAEGKTPLWAPICFAVGVAVLCLQDGSEMFAYMALPLLFFYRGKRGWNGKWFFYLFYPVHLLILGLFF